MTEVKHQSDCAVHNAPALPVGPCDCGAEVRHTPGPWVAHKTAEAHDGLPECWQIDAEHDAVCTTQFCYAPDTAANARLIAAAPDHALIAAALCAGIARWDRSEFCIGGLRHSTRLDEFGVPVMTNGMRAALAKANGEGVS